MINGHLDFGLIFFTIGQYILVFFVGYLAVRGFISLINDIHKGKIISVEDDATYYEKKLELAKKKVAYREYVVDHRLLRSHLFEEEVEIADDLEEQKIEEINDEQNDNTSEEVDIPTLSELIAKEGDDFLKHSDDSDRSFSDSIEEAVISEEPTIEKREEARPLIDTAEHFFRGIFGDKYD